MKEEIETTKNGLVSAFEKQLLKFTCHVCIIKHQYRSIKFIKENLRIDKILLHMDFSENYSCKYTQEVQSLHFGGFRNQVSLHTAVLYYSKDRTVQSVPFCTISEDYRHNNVAICAHLTPVTKKIKNIVPNLNKIHFVHDGTSNQYRNRKMCVLAATFLAKLAKIKILHWHFLEAGHGKEAPDGVGGCLKRTADGIVARGIDIPNFDVLIDQLKINCKGVNIFCVASAEIDDCDKIEVTLPSFADILRAHEISWTKEENLIQIRRLTCTLCLADQHCHHYTIGQILIKAKDW
ncbi:hypothetical protein AVEN_48877-1 [Araneus ventricosus]|uniref:Uncharacterized protein n=1 Tax=Araneus ventricosus TaxID=182803 RepID=A0A4Y2AGP4_ARAVE|nr:hypothetical protein AVEN_48877-1 [Araneus ventricosus]